MSDINQLISIIIPVFNESESIVFLLDEVINVMAANKFNFELIVVNDGSKDNTQQVLKQLTNKIKELIIPYETVGSKIVSTREFLNNLGSIGVKNHFYLRDWDRIAFPFANKGFFPFKNKIHELLIKNGLRDI